MSHRLHWPGFFLCSLVVALSGFGVHRAGVAFAAGCTAGDQVTSANDSGAGSLRQAITTANSHSGDVVCFSAYPGGAINLASSLPQLGTNMTIDGTTAPGWVAGVPVLTINGSGTGGGVGIWVLGFAHPVVTVKGLIVQNFGIGVFVGNSPAGSAAGNGNTFLGNWVINSSNSNLGFGLQTDGNFIGDGTVAGRNVISGNVANGLELDGSNNVVKGNFIGTDASGLAAQGNGTGVNGGDGLYINTTSTGNTIGGTNGTTPGGACTGDCNLISGNGWGPHGFNGDRQGCTGLGGPCFGNGIGMQGGGSNTIKGNYIGTDVSGTGAIPNDGDGVEPQNSPNNTIGGTTPAGRNVISGNMSAGVSITATNSTGNVVEGNYIGVTTSGLSGLSNHLMGVNIGSPNGGGDNRIPSNNTIGGTAGTTPGGACTGACNVISFNLTAGIEIEGCSPGIPSCPTYQGGNHILGNYIGTGSDGTTSMGNNGDGIGITNSQNNQIGDGTANGRNLIDFNNGNGIAIPGGAPNTTGTTIYGNYIGIISNGGAGGNHHSGIMVLDGSSTYIYPNSIGNNDQIPGDIAGDIYCPNNRCIIAFAQHPDGTIINLNSSLYWIQNGTLCTIGSMDVYASWYINSWDVKTGNALDATMPAGTNIYFRDGTLIRGQSSPNVYAIHWTSATTYEKRLITSAPFFNSLGYTIADVISVPDSALGASDGASVGDASQHPDGTVVRDVSNGNIYLLNDSPWQSGTKSYIGSMPMYTSQRYVAAATKAATANDLARSSGNNLNYRNGAVLQGNGSPNIFIVWINGATIEKRQVLNVNTFNSLGYTATDVIGVPPQELPGVDGPSL